PHHRDRQLEAGELGLGLNTPLGKGGRALLGHDLVHHSSRARRISLAANTFEARNRFHETVFKLGPEKSFAEWRPLSRRNSIHILKPAPKAIMQTFLLMFLAMAEPSPRALIVAGLLVLGLLAIFLRHKLR